MIKQQNSRFKVKNAATAVPNGARFTIINIVLLSEEGIIYGLNKYTNVREDYDPEIQRDCTNGYD